MTTKLLQFVNQKREMPKKRGSSLRLKDFDEKYINLLEAGGSMKYKELLQPFNLDPSKSDFWYKGISIIESFINQLDEIE